MTADISPMRTRILSGSIWAEFEERSKKSTLQSLVTRQCAIVEATHASPYGSCLSSLLRAQLDDSAPAPESRGERA
jgi:hypothetical protein